MRDLKASHLDEGALAVNNESMHISSAASCHNHYWVFIKLIIFLLLSFYIFNWFFLNCSYPNIIYSMLS